MRRGHKSLYSVSDYEELASTRLPKQAWDYFSGSANDGVTHLAQRSEFDNIKLKQRLNLQTGEESKSYSKGMLKTTMVLKDEQGRQYRKEVSSPICVASTAFQKMADPNFNLGEISVARTCAESQTALALSSNSNSTIEEVAQANPGGIKFFQIYMSKQETVNLDLWKRCRDNGYHGFAVTCDTQLLGKRVKDVHNKFTLPNHLKISNYEKYGSGNEVGQVEKGQRSTGSALADFMNYHKENKFSWEVLNQIKRATDNTMIVAAKGVMCPEDARLALDNGADVIYVSNHGARQLDTTPTTIEVLAPITAEVRQWELENRRQAGSVQIYFDGGVRTGADVLKALALGADFVFVGRPALWGLACAGQAGVQDVIKILNEELEEAMQRCGVRQISELRDKDIVYKEQELLFAKM